MSNQTNVPTESAAITEPIHMLNICWAWVVTPVGQPKANTSSTEQALSSPSSPAAQATAAAARLTLKPLAATCLCLLRGRHQGRLGTIADYSTGARLTGRGWTCPSESLDRRT